MTEAIGIHQSDIILRSAVIAGIADVRANPWLLRYVFASLPRDDVTMADYGEQEVTRAEEWFLKTDIPVFFNFRGPDTNQFPCIVLSLQESSEAEATLGDTHYIPSERTDSDWPVLAGPFAPAAYVASAGTMRIPVAALGDVVLVAGMVILDRVGHPHPVLEVLDDDLVALAPGTVADFSQALLKGAKPPLVTSLESVSMRETYQIGLYAHGEPTHLTYLYSIVAFILSRYKQDLLEARGFERSVLSWQSFQQTDQFAPEMVYGRTGTLTGYVRNYWPKSNVRDIDATAVDITATSP